MLRSAAATLSRGRSGIVLRRCGGSAGRLRVAPGIAAVLPVPFRAGCFGLQHRLCSSSSSGGARAPDERDDAATNGSAADGPKLVYVGALAKPIRVLKRVSVVTCISSLIAAPLLLVAGSDTVPVAAQIAFSSLILAAGLGSTGLLHYFTKGYIHALYELPAAADGDGDGDGAANATVYEAKLLKFYAKPKFPTFELADVTPLPEHWNPFVSFQTPLSDGSTMKLFVQGAFMEDKEVLKKLLGRKLDEDEKSFEEFDLPSWAKDEHAPQQGDTRR